VIDAPAREASRPRPRLDRRAVLLLVLVFGAALAVSQGCQKSQVRITKEQAIASAQRQVDFRAERTQVRLVRQGLDSQAFWAVSLSVPAADGKFKELATVRVDANTGKVAAVNRNLPGQ
jgi:hypothetical protein